MGFNRRFLKRTVFVLIFGFIFFAPNLYAKGPNFTVDSNDLEPYDLNKKSEPDEKPILYADGNTTVGFNDDAQPNVGVRF